MKFITIFMISFFIVSLVGGTTLVGYSSYTYDKLLTERVHEHLEDIVKIRTNHVNTFLEGKKDIVIVFASDGFIKDSLNSLKKGANSTQIAVELKEDILVNKLQTDKDLYEIDILDTSGIVVGTTQIEKELGEDKSNDLLFLNGRRGLYIKGAFYDDEFERDAIAISAPITDEDEFLGVILIKMTLDQLKEIVISAGKFSQYEELYILDENSFMITPSDFLKGENKGVLTQKVDTENAENCLDTTSVNDDRKNTRINYFLNYRGEEVVGIYNHIPDTSWCLLVEIEVEGGLEIPQKEFFKSQIIFYIFVITLLTLIGLFAGRYLDKRFLLKEKGGK